MVKIVGVDLAGMQKNDTGIAVLDLETKTIKAKTVKTDEEIVKTLEEELPDLVCIDAPLTLPLRNLRRADMLLSKYGKLPPLLGGMQYLTMRGNKLREILEKKYKIIEIYAKASAQILGFFDEDRVKMQKELVSLGLQGDIVRRELSKDEVDAAIAALTGYLYMQAKTEEVGDNEGKIVIPKV